jgi:hypothetical protein
MSLVFNIFPDDIGYNFISNTPDEVSIIPHFSCPKLLPQLGILFEYFSGRYAFHYLYYFRRRIPRWCSHEYVHMVFHYSYRIYLKFIFLSNLFEDFFKVLRFFWIHYLLSIFRYPYQVVLQIIDRMLCPSYSHAAFIPILRLFGNPFLRLAANHFYPPSKLRGIKWSLK